MYISKISNPTFSARTLIHAPQNLLNDDDRVFLKSLGAKIGSPNDQISISVGKPEQSEGNPHIISYKLTRKARFTIGDKVHILDNTKFVPYITNDKINTHSEPKEYLVGVFKQLAQQYNLCNTVVE